jgi:hypothetical protein
MAKQIIAILVMIFSISSGATIQSSDTVGRTDESIMYPDTGIQVEYYKNGKR